MAYRDPITGMKPAPFAVSMAMDAFRMALDRPLRTWTQRDVLHWLLIIAEQEPTTPPAGK